MKITKLVLCIFLFVGIANCKENMTTDETIYKKEATELKNLTSKFLSIKMETQIISRPNNQGELYICDTKKREMFLKKTKDKWLSIDRALKEFALEYPSSKWADDAAFCRALEFTFARPPLKLFSQERINTISEFLKEYPTFRVEEWTKTHFSQTYKTFFHGILSDDSLSEAQIIRGRFYLMLITEHCLNKDFQEADEELMNLESEGASKLLIETGKFMRDHYKEEARNGKTGTSTTK